GNIVNQTTSGLIKVGLGSLEFGGTSTNNYIGGTLINSGTLLLDKQTVAQDQFQPNATGSGTVTVGNEAGGAVVGWGQFANVDQIQGFNFTPTTAASVVTNSIVVTSSGTVDLATNNKSDWVNGIVLETGRVTSSLINTGSGTLTATGDITVNTFGVTDGASPAATINGTLQLSGALDTANIAQNFTVNPTFINSGNSVLQVNATLAEVTPTVDPVN